jgi:hypothetical protein
MFITSKPGKVLKVNDVLLKEIYNVALYFWVL